MKIKLHGCRVVVCDLPNITLKQVAYFTGIVGMYRFSATIRGAGVATASRLLLFAIMLLLLYKFERMIFGCLPVCRYVQNTFCDNK